MEYIDFLNKNAGAFTVVFTAIVTLSTVVYAFLTARLATETKRMREVQTEPKIHIKLENFDFMTNIFRLNIQNIGLSQALNLKFETSVISGGESAEKLLKDFTESNFFNIGLRYLGPNQNLHSTFTQMFEDYDEKIASMLSIKLKYQSVTGKNYNDEIIIDMSEIKGTYQLGTPNLYSIAKSLEKIQKDISSTIDGFKKIKINVYSSDDREKEDEELKKRYAKK
jgi:hypothetical protein